MLQKRLLHISYNGSIRKTREVFIMKKVLAFLLAVSLSAAVLGGCGASMAQRRVRRTVLLQERQPELLTSRIGSPAR